MSCHPRRVRSTLSTQESFVGWKVANLLATVDGKQLAFDQIHQDGSSRPYGVEAVARCNYWDHHMPPVADCRCGFSAFQAQLTALQYRQKISRKITPQLITHNLVVLRVSLSGNVLEHSSVDVPGVMYRGHQQKVEAVFLPKKCARCQQRAAVAAVTDEIVVFGGAYAYLRPTCRRHVGLESPTFTPAQLARLAKVEVGWL